MIASVSQAVAAYQRGPANGATWGLLRNDDNAIEGAKIDGRPQHDGLRERSVSSLDLDHGADRKAGMERSSLARHHNVADAHRRILFDVVDDDAREISARNS